MQYYYSRAEQQFGPMSWDALFAAARSGVFTPNDLVWAEGWNTWRVAQTVPGLLPAAVPSKPMGADPAMRYLLPIGRSGWAIAAGYLGLFSVLVFPAPLALITGILAVLDIKKNPQKYGMGRAIFGIVMGVIFTTFLVFALAANRP